METNTCNRNENFRNLENTCIINLYIHIYKLPEGRRRQKNYRLWRIYHHSSIRKSAGTVIFIRWQSLIRSICGNEGTFCCMGQLGSIKGFEYEPGYEYTLRISETNYLDHSMGDPAWTEYELLKLISKEEKTSDNVPNNFIPEWFYTEYCTALILNSDIILMQKINLS